MFMSSSEITDWLISYAASFPSFFQIYRSKRYLLVGCCEAKCTRVSLASGCVRETCARVHASTSLPQVQQAFFSSMPAPRVLKAFLKRWDGPTGNPGMFDRECFCGNANRFAGNLSTGLRSFFDVHFLFGLEPQSLWLFLPLEWCPRANFQYQVAALLDSATRHEPIPAGACPEEIVGLQCSQGLMFFCSAVSLFLSDPSAQQV